MICIRCLLESKPESYVHIQAESLFEERCWPTLLQRVKPNPEQYGTKLVLMASA